MINIDKENNRLVSVLVEFGYLRQILIFETLINPVLRGLTLNTNMANIRYASFYLIYLEL